MTPKGIELRKYLDQTYTGIEYERKVLGLWRVDPKQSIAAIKILVEEYDDKSEILAVLENIVEAHIDEICKINLLAGRQHRLRGEYDAALTHFIKILKRNLPGPHIQLLKGGISDAEKKAKVDDSD